MFLLNPFSGKEISSFPSNFEDMVSTQWSLHSKKLCSRFRKQGKDLWADKTELFFACILG